MTQKKTDHSVKKFLHKAAIVLNEQDTVNDTLNLLREKKCKGKIIYFYVVDAEKRLKGTVSTRSLLISEPEVKIEKIMEDHLIFLEEGASFEKALDSLLHHRLLALPVLNERQQLLGVFDVQVCLEENIDLFKEQRSQDIFQLVGMTQAEIAYKNPFKSYSKRMPWILCNMVGGIACAGISYGFQDVLAKMLVLAMFIPLILSISESISMQSMAHSFQILRKQQMTWKKIFSQMFLEMRVAALMSCTSGVLVGAISFLWEESIAVSCVIAVGIAVSVIFAGMIGSAIPLFLHLKKLDPKVASGPVVLTLADVVTTALYLAVASWWIL